MRRLFVLKDVAYAAKKGGGTIAGANELNTLAPGALAILDQNGKLLTIDGVSGGIEGLGDIKKFILAGGEAQGVQVINEIPRQDIFELNLKPYREPVAMVVTVGGTDAPLVFADNEEAVIKVIDSSFTSRYNLQHANVSTMKRAGETNSAVIDRIVDRLNAAGSFVTAAKVGTTDADWGITVTPNDPRTHIDVALSGTFEYGKTEVTTPAVYGDGLGVDLVQMEKDSTAERGNGNYIDYTEAHYKRTIEADGSESYDIINFVWEGRHSSPTRSHNVMRNHIMIACVDGAANQEATAIMTMLGDLVGLAYDAVDGEEPGNDDGTENDGIAGN